MERTHASLATAEAPAFEELDDDVTKAGDAQISNMVYSTQFVFSLEIHKPRFLVFVQSYAVSKSPYVKRCVPYFLFL